MARELKPCGTIAAYQRHRRHGEDPCEPCREANRAHSGPATRARNAAVRRLIDIYPDVFDALFTEELAKEKTR
jgi:hypothetical protein